MKNTIKLLLTIVAAFAGSYFGNFIITAILILFVHFIINTSLKSSLSIGVFGAGLIWAGFAFYYTENGGDIIMTRVSALMTLSEFQLILVIAFLGAIIGGISAFAGYSIRNTYSKKKKNLYTP